MTRPASGRQAASSTGLDETGAGSAPTRATAIGPAQRAKLKRDLRADAAGELALLHRDQRAGARRRSRDGGDVERGEAAQVDHLAGDALRGQPLGRLQRDAGHVGIGDDGDVLAAPTHRRLADRHERLGQRHLAGGGKQALVVDDRRPGRSSRSAAFIRP